jgi:adenosylcobyric acid synthase
MDWRVRSNLLWPIVQDSLENLLNQYEIVVIEGAGSPAEINLASPDIVNMRVAEIADAKVLLVVDIDRGGAFAHLFGTHALLQESEQKRIAGFVLNKFRGDPNLLAPGPEILTKHTGMKFAGIIPFFHHAIPNEEGPSLHISSHSRKSKNIQIICGPYASSLDDSLDELTEKVMAGIDAEWLATFIPQKGIHLDQGTTF